jgi:hypothetical protein
VLFFYITKGGAGRRRAPGIGAAKWRRRSSDSLRPDARPTFIIFFYYRYIYEYIQKHSQEAEENTSACPHIEQGNMKTILSGVLHERDFFISSHAGTVSDPSETVKRQG